MLPIEEVGVQWIAKEAVHFLSAVGMTTEGK